MYDIGMQYLKEHKYYFGFFLCIERERIEFWDIEVRCIRDGK